MMLSGKNLKSICKFQLFVEHIKVLYNVVSMGVLTKSSSFEMTLFIFIWVNLSIAN